MARIALFGSSYIARLEEFCWGDLKVPGDVRFFGIGGMKFETCAETMKKVKSFKPGAVYIFLGGNSITKNTKPSELADDNGYIITGRNACGIPVFVYLVSRDG